MTYTQSKASLRPQSGTWAKTLFPNVESTSFMNLSMASLVDLQFPILKLTSAQKIVLLKEYAQLISNKQLKNWDITGMTEIGQ